MKDSFILYQDNREVFDTLSDEEAGKLIKAIFEYEESGQEIEMPPTVKIAFIPIKQSLNRNKEKYENTCEKNRENIQKRWNTKNTTVSFGKNKNTKNTDNDNDNEHDNEHEKNIYTPSEQSSSGGVAKANDIIALKDKELQAPKEVKHKYGEYQHVLLKDSEVSTLKKEYSNFDELIKYLDEYIEMKGYKAKSHYLCIKKWVASAVKEKQINSPQQSSSIEDRVAEMRRILGGTNDTE